MIDQNLKDRKISIRHEVELSRPFGITSFATTAALKNIRLRKLSPEEVAKTAPKKWARVDFYQHAGGLAQRWTPHKNSELSHKPLQIKHLWESFLFGEGTGISFAKYQAQGIEHSPGKRSRLII